MPTVLLVRHGQTRANSAGLLAGRSPGVGLDPTGIIQVRKLASAMAPVPLAAAISSPLQRCRQTAQLLLDGRPNKLSTRIDTGLIECDYGLWTGRKISELAAEPLWQTVQQQPAAARFPAGEALSEMAARAVETIRRIDAEILAEHGPDAVWLAVSHGDVLKAILGDALGCHLDMFQRILLNPASVSVVRYTPSRPYVLTMNSTGSELAAHFTSRKPPSPHDESGSDSGPHPGAPTRAEDDAPIGGGLGAAGFGAVQPADNGTNPNDGVRARPNPGSPG